MKNRKYYTMAELAASIAANKSTTATSKSTTTTATPKRKSTTASATPKRKSTNTYDANERNSVARITTASVLRKVTDASGNPHVDSLRKDLAINYDRMPSVAVERIDDACMRERDERAMYAYALKRLTNARKKLDDLKTAAKNGTVVPISVLVKHMAVVRAWTREYAAHKEAYTEASADVQALLAPLGDSADLVQVAHMRIEELHADGRDMDDRFTVKTTNRKIFIQSGDVYEIERETMGRREVFRAIRQEIAEHGNGEVASHKYTYLDAPYMLTDGTVVSLYERLPLYADMGGYVTDANGKRIAYTADEQACRDVDALISAFGLTPIQTDVLMCLRDGRGNKAAARRLKITENTVKSARREIRRKAAKYYKNAVDEDGVPMPCTLLDVFTDEPEGEPASNPAWEAYKHTTTATVNEHTITFASVDDVHKRNVHMSANKPANDEYTWDADKREWTIPDGAVTVSKMSPADLAKYRK